MTKKKNSGVFEKSKVHLCYDCVKAEAGTCEIYENITTIIDENFDYCKILFQVEECEYFVQDPSIDNKNDDFEDF